MARYIDADLLEKAIDDAQSGLESNDDRTWKRNKSYFKGLAWARALLNEATTTDVVEVKQIEIIRDDLKWWLETNFEKGVVYIPKYVVENMIAKMEGVIHNG